MCFVVFIEQLISQSASWNSAGRYQNVRSTMSSDVSLQHFRNAAQDPFLFDPFLSNLRLRGAGKAARQKKRHSKPVCV